MNDSDYRTYKPRSIIFAWENDFFSHIEEARKWESALIANAYKNHQEDRMQALLNVNLERNTKKLWRPWHRCDDMNRVLRSATDQEYKDILKDLIVDRVALPKKNREKKEDYIREEAKEQRRTNWFLDQIRGTSRRNKSGRNGRKKKKRGKTYQEKGI